MITVLGAVLKAAITVIFFGCMALAGIFIGKKLRENKDNKQQ